MDLRHRYIAALLIGLLLPLALLSSVAHGQTTQSVTRIYLPLIVRAPSQATVSSLAEQQVVDLTNQERLAHGCPALTVSPQLTSAAQGHSRDMATRNYFSHTSLDGATLSTRLDAAGYSYSLAAENIAAGQPTAAAVVSAWMASTKGHRENILNCQLTEIGVGYAEASSSEFGVYWTQDFGTPLSK